MVARGNISENHNGEQTASVARTISAIIISTVIFMMLYFVILHFTGHRLLDAQNRTDSLSSEIRKNVSIGQTFCTDGSELCGISIKFATYSRPNNGPLVLSLYRVNNLLNPVCQNTINTFFLRDNNFHYFSLTDDGKSGPSCYLFTLKNPKGERGNAVSVWYHSKDLYQKGTRYVGGVRREGDLSFRVYGRLPLDQLLFRIGENKPYSLYLFPLLIFLLLFSTFTLIFLLR